MHLMIFGAGYTGRAIAQQAMQNGIKTSVTSRSILKIEELRYMGLSAFLFDGKEILPTLKETMHSVTHLVQAIAPNDTGDPLIHLIDQALLSFLPNLRWIGYISTTSVYGNHDGRWVTEKTPAQPLSCQSKKRLGIETQWLRIGEILKATTIILRLSGIYGPQRNAFISLETGTAKRLIKKNQVFNRIRVEDIARSVIFLIKNNISGIINITDDEPAPPQDVITTASILMKILPPPEQLFEEVTLSGITKSFYGENKRVSNAKIKNLGFHFLYPNYRMSLQQLWESKQWK
ncbi:SDR family oxidoreductase [Liberibacter crescens]|uniref:SDR family oxidoreductase n=1 Tax=Liberibacter crescens TaxID=1273132 RepID=UPI000762E760|nr:SDR family oxidoreductase [Liberibacter crescens]AMC13109.1 oxidoreductase [Liberibacter crescens]